ncbi:kelch-like protein 5 [Lates japonicus]|uniref:Kelch-like protein 5 n=1 Tax=Lates japonicus TaxID=270547 RepID=A0AAD3N7Y5_LATJO|nr:kelch-like protein 5 [Lates japonicus]
MCQTRGNRVTSFVNVVRHGHPLASAHLPLLAHIRLPLLQPQESNLCLDSVECQRLMRRAPLAPAAGPLPEPSGHHRKAKLRGRLLWVVWIYEGATRRAVLPALGHLRQVATYEWTETTGLGAVSTAFT